MAFPDRRTANILLTILLFAGIGVVVYSARRIILIFVFAILFTYLIDPVVKFLQRHSLVRNPDRASGIQICAGPGQEYGKTRG